MTKLKLLSGVIISCTAFIATPALAAPECWRIDFRGSDFRGPGAPQPVVSGSFTVTIDWQAPTTTPAPHPDTVDVKIAGHTFTPNELNWTYSPKGEQLIFGPSEPLEDKELFVTAGQNGLFLLVQNTRTSAVPAVLVYSVTGATEKWVTTNVTVSVAKCAAPPRVPVFSPIGLQRLWLCDIGKDVIGGGRWRPVVIRNRSKRTMPAGTTINYSTPATPASPAAEVSLRLQKELRPGEAVAGPPTQATTCSVADR